MQFSYRVHKNGAEKLLAVADEAIVGRKFEEGELVLDVTASFYAGKKCTREEVKELVESAGIINAVGTDIIEILVANGMADKENVLKVKGVPHAQIIKA